MIVSYHRINVTLSNIVTKWKRKREQNKHLADQPRSDWPSKIVGVVGKESREHKIQRLYIGGKSTKKCSKELNISDASSLAPKSWYCYRLVKYTQCSIRQTVNANIMWIKSFKNNLNLPWINKKTTGRVDERKMVQYRGHVTRIKVVRTSHFHRNTELS